MDYFYQEFGKRVKAARQAAKVSQEKLADAVGLNRTSITNIESGRQHIPLHSLFLLAEALNVHPTKLLPDQIHSMEIDPATEKAIQAIGLSDEVKNWLHSVLNADKTLNHREISS